MFRTAMLIVVLVVAALASTLGYWFLRPNRAAVDAALGLESWDVVRDGLHNSNTDLIEWNDGFLLAHAASPYHLGSKACRIILRFSQDGREWTRLAELRMPGEDIRDPKLARIGGKLFLYALPNRGLAAKPYGTVYATSDDGQIWSSFAPIDLPGWLLWRPKTRDGNTWYAGAYWHEHGKSALLSSRDGVHWAIESVVHGDEGNDETDVELLRDGRILLTARLEMAADSAFGHRDAGTLLALADPPYREWSRARSTLTRLDGPALFQHGGRVYAVARHQPGPRHALNQLGGVFSRKRTAIFLVEPDRLVHLTDLPSAGDTSYAGVVVRDGAAWISYYTSDISSDYPWLLGMLAASDIRLARVSLEKLEAVATMKGARGA